MTMAWAPLCSLALLYCCSDVHSQPTVTQAASQSVSLGETVKISCLRSSGGNWGGFGWYQQRDGQSIRFLSYGGRTRGEGVPDRFTGFSSGTNGYLTITNTQPEDESIYYCGAWENTGGSKYIFGGGTSLAISGLPATPPTVRAFPPSAEEIKDKNTATLTCLINDFYPAPIDVTWLADGTDITQKAETARPTKQGEKYVSSSYLTMSAAEYNSHNRYTCKVTHEGKTYEQSIQRS